MTSFHSIPFHLNLFAFRVCVCVSTRVCSCDSKIVHRIITLFEIVFTRLKHLTIVITLFTSSAFIYSFICFGSSCFLFVRLVVGKPCFFFIAISVFVRDRMHLCFFPFFFSFARCRLSISFHFKSWYVYGAFCAIFFSPLPFRKGPELNKLIRKYQICTYICDPNGKARA